MDKTKIENIKKDFPILQKKINNKEIVYLDNAATSQIPKQVVDKMVDFEFNHRANIHRSNSTLGDEATNFFENSRENVANFINANIPEEVIFTKNSTESINIAAIAWGKENLNKGDIILCSETEHNSNLLPWIELCKEKKCEIKYIPVDRNGLADMQNIEINYTKVKLITLTHASNTLGAINNIKEIQKHIKKRLWNEEKPTKAQLPKFLLDCSQTIAHIPINVKKLGVDFLAFSGHKMYGPMGIGILWINREISNQIGYFTTGGGMLKEINNEGKPIYKELPERLEAGTQNIPGTIGLSAACDYIKNIGFEKIMEHNQVLTQYAIQKLLQIPNIEIYSNFEGSNGVQENNVGIISFNIKGIPAHDVSAILDMEGIQTRSGQHCSSNWYKTQNIKTSVRISFAIYNTTKDIDKLINGIKKAQKIFNI